MALSTAKQATRSAAKQISPDDIVSVISMSESASDPKIQQFGEFVSKISGEITSARESAPKREEFVRVKRAALEQMQIILEALFMVTDHDAPVVEGNGLGELLTEEEGLSRLDAYAARTPLEAWAGQSLGAVELQKKLGVPRSTLQKWRKANAVIGLPRGQRNFVFPLAQFDEDGQPYDGLENIVKLAGSPRAAWLWLIERKSDSRDSYLSKLKNGDRNAVLGAARRRFG